MGDPAHSTVPGRTSYDMECVYAVHQLVFPGPDVFSSSIAHLERQRTRGSRLPQRASGTIARPEHQASLPNSRAALSTLNESGMEIGA